MADPTRNTGAAQGDSLFGVDNLIGGSGNDALHGNARHNEIDGRGGNDRLFGGGDDILRGAPAMIS